MKVKEYLNALNELVKEDPSILKLDVIYASDAEGNSVDLCLNTPTVQKWDKRFYCFDEDDGKKALCLN